MNIYGVRPFYYDGNQCEQKRRSSPSWLSGEDLLKTRDSVQAQWVALSRSMSILRQLAENSGVSQPFISQIKKVERVPSAFIAKKDR